MVLNLLKNALFTLTVPDIQLKERRLCFKKNYTSIAFVAFPDLLKAAYKFLSQIKHFDKSWPKNAAMGEEGVKICEKLLTSFMHGPKSS